MFYLFKVLAFFCSGFADEENTVFRQGCQLKFQLCRRMVEIGRLVSSLLSVLQNEVQNPCCVEVARVECRAPAFRQNKFLGRDEVVDSAGNSAGHHGYPDVEDDIQSPGSEFRDDL